MSSKPSVLVAGAGVAGLAAAKGLHDQGWQVHLVERRPAADTVPTGLFIPANGMRAFAALGAGRALLCCGQAIGRLPRTRDVQQATAMRNALAALTLQDRTALVVPKWAELSTALLPPSPPSPERSHPHA